MNNEYENIHDNEILSYFVDISNKILRLSTKYYDKEKTTITFTSLMCHRFENITYSNIIYGITMIPIDEFIDANKEMLEEGLKNAFPMCLKDCEELRGILKEDNQKIFYISSSLGLSGFVIAREICIETEQLNKV